MCEERHQGKRVANSLTIHCHAERSDIELSSPHRPGSYSIPPQPPNCVETVEDVLESLKERAADG